MGDHIGSSELPQSILMVLLMLPDPGYRLCLLWHQTWLLAVPAGVLESIFSLSGPHRALGPESLQWPSLLDIWGMEENSQVMSIDSELLVLIPPPLKLKAEDITHAIKIR